jgi:dihydroorotate dehydrogenase (fumarate)
MINLSTNYLGLSLVSPLIVSSCGLTGSADKIKRFAELGAGAVVLKSLFEEQIRHEAGSQIQASDYPEAYDYISRYVKSNSLEEYIKLIESAKKAVNIPIIASLNCISASEWISFAKSIESAGADALELNVYFLASEKDVAAEKIENLYYELLRKIREVVNIPLSVKIGYQFSNLAATVNNFYLRGAKGVVLFNRFYEPDLDIEAMKIVPSEVLSSPADIRQSLRWVGILSDKVERIDIAASTGIHDGKAVVKQILAGAKAVQVCSVLYKQGEKQIAVILDDLKLWMTRKNYSTLDEFRGKLNYSHIADPATYERSQFMRYFSDFQ